MNQSRKRQREDINSETDELILKLDKELDKLQDLKNKMKKSRKEITKIKLELSQFPHEFYCPITKELMKDPVIFTDGHTYEREAIMNWLKDNDTSPMTNLPTNLRILISNISLRKLIQEKISLYNWNDETESVTV